MTPQTFACPECKRQLDVRLIRDDVYYATCYVCSLHIKDIQERDLSVHQPTPATHELLTELIKQGKYNYKLQEQALELSRRQNELIKKTNEFLEELNNEKGAK